MSEHRLIMALGFLLSACHGGVPAADDGADSTAIATLIDRATAMNNAGDVEGWVALFEDGAVYMPPGSPEVRTVEGLREVATAGFGRWDADVRMVPAELVVLGDWAFSRTRVTGSVTATAGGDPIPIDIKQLALYHRQPDGTWRIARLINNSNHE